ncbi:MAG TPA: 2-phosphosulfolactate phosphatase [Chthoniobacterales bacterium]|nr:2-phosphosulfolactate phosphatase [Chthoniobacterales bacterium]
MIDVALCPSEIRRFESIDLSGTTAVVFDVLRATSTMITGLEYGVEQFFPVETIDAARALKIKDSSLLLAGERGGLPLEGFDLGNSPGEFKEIRGKSVVLTTTNGTVALHRVRRAKRVYVGALLNLDSLAQALDSEGSTSVLIVCAGTGEDFALEDAVAAGGLVNRLSRNSMSDAAVLVKSLYREASADLLSYLRQSRNGRSLAGIGKAQDVEECARLSVSQTVGVMKGDAVVKLT